MSRVWEDDARYDKWLQIEVAVCEAWAEEGVIPEAEMAQIRRATYDLAIFDEAMKETKHDMTAFLRAMYPSVGSGARYLHLGLTTSDVWDTALSMQMVEAVGLLLGEVDRLIRALESKAREHKDTVMIGRTHGVHAEPITFGLKLALWVDEMRRNRDRLKRLKGSVGVGKISGAVGTYALVSPEIEERVCRRLGLKPARISNQIVQRDIHAEFSMTLALVGASLEKFATELRSLQRTEILEVEEPFGKGQTGSSAMPHKRNPIICERICGSGASDARERGGGAGGRGTLERERHQPLVGGADYNAGLLPGSGLLSRPVYGGYRGNDGASGEHDEEPGVDAGAGVLAEGVDPAH